MPIAVIGGLRVRAAWAAPEFAFRSFLALRQARRAQGCLGAQVFPGPEGFFSLTLWDSAAAMKTYATTGAHGRLLRRAPVIAEVFRFHHFPAEVMPEPAEARAHWYAAQHGLQGENGMDLPGRGA